MVGRSAIRLSNGYTRSAADEVSANLGLEAPIVGGERSASGAKHDASAVRSAASSRSAGRDHDDAGCAKVSKLPPFRCGPRGHSGGRQCKANAPRAAYTSDTIAARSSGATSSSVIWRHKLIGDI